MTSDRGDQNTVDLIFSRALDLSPQERGEFLTEACRGDQALHDKVTELLAATEKDDDFLAPGGGLRGRFFQPTDENRSIPAPNRIGQFRIVKEIGRGGMSVVYLAEREAGDFDQRVAIKLIKPGSDSEEVLRRFEQERRILASLSHPSIARLFDGGATDDGRPYFTMELVAGLPIVDFCRERGLDIKERLKLFATVAEAVAHAHGQSIVHRDLKPSNVLVDDAGQVRLLDFGIAKMLDAQHDGQDPLTYLPHGPLTPEYASPEQIRGQEVTSASDVYQLGVLLYELLTDRLPYRLETEEFQSLAGAICEQTPTRPSMVVTLPAAHDGKDSLITSSRDWQRRLRGDLDAIVMTALRKEPQRRYPSARAFADDIERYLKGKPVVARGDSLAYRVKKLVGRYRLVGATTAVLIVLTVAGFIYRGLVTTELNPAPLENAIAVLPFNVGGVDEVAYLGNGIADSLITGLAAIPELRVVARASSFSFRGDDLGVGEIASRLGVNAVVTGRVTKTEDGLSVQAQLIDAPSETILWAQTYDQTSNDVLEIQKKITADLIEVLARVLNLQLPPVRGPSGATDNLEAYELYLLGQHHYQQRGEGVRESIRLFGRAVELDPDFAYAWAALASAYSSALTWGGAPDNVEELIRETSLRAIELDDTIGLAFMTLGGIDARRGKYAEATPYLIKALAVSPNDPTVLLWSWEGMGDLGRLEDSREFAQRLYEVNPVSPTSSSAIGWANVVLGNLGTARRFCQRAFDQGMGTRCSLFASLEGNDFDAARDWFEQGIPEDAEASRRMMQLYLAARRNPTDANTQAALVAIDEVLWDKESSTAFYYYATLGDLGRAFATLNARYDRGELVATDLWWLPSLSAFRRDPRFAGVAERAGMIDFWRAFGWADSCRPEGSGIACE